MLGAAGELHRMDGTIIGDSVNLASRLEMLTKKFKCKIFASRETLKKSNHSSMKRVMNRYLGRVQVKGKKIPIDLHEIFDGSEQEKQNHRFEFSQAVQMMQESKFDEAEVAFKSFSEQSKDLTSEVLLRYCRTLKNSQSQWNGVFEMSEK